MEGLRINMPIEESKINTEILLEDEGPIKSSYKIRKSLIWVLGSLIAVFAVAVGTIEYLKTIPSDYVVQRVGEIANAYDKNNMELLPESEEDLLYIPSNTDLNHISFFYNDNINLWEQIYIAWTEPTATFIKKEDKPNIAIGEEAQELSVKTSDSALIAAYNYLNKEKKNILQVFLVDESAPLYSEGLRSGDYISYVNGLPLREVEDLSNYIAENTLVKELEFSVIRLNPKNNNYDFLKISTPNVDAIEELGILGFPTPYIPYTYQFNNSSMAGGSVGLISAIAAVELLDKEEITLASGKIAGTGGITIDGKVTKIVGVYQKALTALKNEASIFIIPKDNCGELLETEVDLKSMEVHAVSTLSEAVDVVQGSDEFICKR